MTDASDTSWGASLHGKLAGGHFMACEIDRYINWKETKVIQLALQSFKEMI